MTKRQWIEGKLLEYDYDVSAFHTPDMYDLYCIETDSDASYDSYRRNVLRVKESLLESQPEALKDDGDLPEETDSNKLLTILEEEVRTQQSRLSMSELSSIAKRRGFSPESFSKAFPDLKRLLSDIYRISGLEIENDIDSIKLKRKIKVLQSEVDELKNQHADYSQLVDMLEDVVEVYTPWDQPSRITPSFRSEGSRAMVALFSDLHAGELVSLEETHGLNEYNQEIMKQRIDSFFNQVVDYAEELKLDVLHLKMLGDMVNGEIHEELIRNSDLDTVESLILVADYTSQWIRELAKSFSEVHVLALSGNHGRFSKKPNFKKKQILNFDYLAYEFMRRETQDLVDSFDLPKSPYTIRDILGHRFFTAHGDQFKGGTGLNPVSGTWGRDIEKMKGLYQSTGGFEYAEFAHFHTPILDIPSFSGVSMIVNGAVKGLDEFSIGAVKAGSRPSQIVYTIDKREGVKFRTTLYLDN